MNLTRELRFAAAGLLISFTLLGALGAAVHANRHAPATHKLRLI